MAAMYSFGEKMTWNTCNQCRSLDTGAQIKNIQSEKKKCTVTYLVWDFQKLYSVFVIFYSN